MDRDKKTVELLLEDGSSHSTSLKDPDSHQGGTFDRQVISLDAASVFRRSTLLKGDNEMSIAELRAKDAEAAKAGAPSYGQYFIQLKYSIPAACLVLALVGLTLGVTNRKDGKFASFVLGFVVVFIYQQIMWTCRGLALHRPAVARAGRVDPEHRGRRRRHRAAAVAGGIERSADPLHPARLSVPLEPARSGRGRHAAGAGPRLAGEW